MPKHHRNRSELFIAHPADSHLPVLAQKSARGTTDNSKTNVVVGIVGRVVVAIGGAAIPRIVVPRTAAFTGLSHLYSKPSVPRTRRVDRESYQHEALGVA